MKKKTLKLKLHRETIRNLQDSLEAGQVAGGIVCTRSDTTCPSKPVNSCHCTTTDTCP